MNKSSSINYPKNYVNSFHKAINTTEFKFKEDKLTQNVFFSKLNDQILKIKSKGGKFYFFGNGASCAFSNHMALDWSKNGGILSYAPSDSSLLTALANDYSFEDSFVEFLKINRVNQNDLVFTTSSSGNSDNIINVLKYCNSNDIDTVAFSGLNDDNFSINHSKYSIYVPAKTYGMVECIHQFFHHLILDYSMEIKEWEREIAQNMDSKNFLL